MGSNIFWSEINVSQPAGTAQKKCCTCHALTGKQLFKIKTRAFYSIVPKKFAGELPALGMINSESSFTAVAVAHAGSETRIHIQ